MDLAQQLLAGLSTSSRAATSLVQRRRAGYGKAGPINVARALLRRAEHDLAGLEWRKGFSVVPDWLLG